MNRFKIALILTMLTLSACSMNDDSKFSTKVEVASPSELKHLESNFELIKLGATMSLNRHFVFILPVYWERFDEEHIVNQMLMQHEGDLITNLEIEKKFIFLYYYSRYYVYVKGDIWKRKNLL